MDKYKFVQDYLEESVAHTNRPDKKREKIQLKIDRLLDELSDARAAIKDKCEHTSLLVEHHTDCSGDGYGGTDWYEYTTVKCEYCRISSRIGESNPFGFTDDGLKLQGKFDLKRSYDEHERLAYAAAITRQKEREEEEEREQYKQLKKKYG